MNDYDAPEGMEQPMTKGELERMGKKWLEKIRANEKREEFWSKEAERAEKAYLGNEGDKTEGKIYDFNILHSNIETMVPAVFNSAPIPDIRERFRTGASDPQTAAARIAAQVIERAIMVQVDDSALVIELEEVTQDALLAGRGVIRVKFEADELPAEPVIDPMGMPMVDPMTGLPMMGEPRIVNERLIYECVSWRDYREGPANRWQDVPWVAFRHCLPWEEVQRIQDPALKEILSVGGTEGEDEPECDADTFVWEVWCKHSGKVYMIVHETGAMLSIVPDPLGLKGFFPVARPVQPVSATGDRKPVCPFTIYKALANELERVTKRINAITEGLKVRGGVAGDSADIEAMAAAGDNELVPIANLEAYAATGGIEKAIVWWPVDKAIVVLRELYASREQTKSMIYEVTGISDIIRGESSASETATAQQIKSQWGSLRIRKLQQQIERVAREIFVMSAELICTKFGPETLQSMTGIQMTPEVAQILSAPLDHYRIDVESDSTIRADLSRAKGEMGEFLQGTAAFFQAMTPVVQQAPQLAGPVAEIFASFARQFNLGKQAEDALEEMGAVAKQAAQQQQPQGPSPEQITAEAKAKAEDGKLQIEQGKLQLSGQELGLKQQELQIKAVEAVNNMTRPQVAF
jgi:hypothetical protein